MVHCHEANDTEASTRTRLSALKVLDVSRPEIARHFTEKGYSIDLNATSVLEREPNWRRRIVKGNLDPEVALIQ